jgi:transposase
VRAPAKSTCSFTFAWNRSGRPSSAARPSSARSRVDSKTTAGVAEVIRREFGVSYHRAHISRVLRDIGWSLQKPVRRAVQRDEKAIEAWRKKRWPTLKENLKSTVRRSFSTSPGSI